MFFIKDEIDCGFNRKAEGGGRGREWVGGGGGFEIGV